MAGSGLGGALVQHGGSIDTREELVGALAVAAELEHFLLAQYLFAAYSMKKRPSEGISERQVELARRWEGVLLAVAREEMAHLAIVVNLSTAVGGAPHFNRPNFPQRAGPVYPFDLRLQRFGLEAIRRFVRFEQPADAFPAAFRVEIAPDPVEFTFLGDLYRQIRAGLETLVSRFGEQWLFVGPAAAQDNQDWGAGVVVSGVTDLSSAVAAIDDVVVAGEGSGQQREGSHWDRFRQVEARLVTELEQSPGFDPARNVAPDPATRPHPDAHGQSTALPPGSLALAVAELFNHVYSTMLFMLAQYYSFAGESVAQRAGLQAGARRAMSAIARPLAEVLTEMPIDGGDGLRAGPGFETYGLVELPSSQQARWAVLDERLERAAGACRTLSGEPGLGRLTYLSENLQLLLAAVRDLEAGTGREDLARPRA
ncbi:MAG TPA: ferritin-like domain-containing protein [Acidimicrobiales bacterium]|nr:ferritin-like domain-containing protein [Acidimicrobiales bacterium]